MSRVHGLLENGFWDHWILSVPMTSLVKIALESYEGTRGLGIMLGSDTKLEWIEGLETADAIRREKKKDL